MNVITLHNPPAATSPLPPCVATIGFFDGVHLGHQFLISHVKADAEKSSLASLVITFDHHPREVLGQDYQPRLLTTLDEKLRRLQSTGIDDVAVLHFDRAMSRLTACEFMQQVLKERLNVKKLVIGYDNRFGHNRAEGFDDYVHYGRELGIEVIHNEAFLLDGIKVSSSVVRKLLDEGDIELANRCLGYDFSLSGHVEHGFAEGRKLGYPTANLSLPDPHLLIPANGVYAVQAKIGDESLLHEGMMNIGTRPTFNGSSLSLETYIFDFYADIYGQPLTIVFKKRIREEQRFDGEEALAAQLHRDEAAIRQYFALRS